MKKAIITGITGQDGSYLAELLLKKGYHVYGLKRRASSFNTMRIDHLFANKEYEGKIFYSYYDSTDSTAIIRLIQEIRPNEIYNLAAMSHVRVSFDMPEYTGNADGLGTLRILEAIRILKLEKEIKFYQASTSELYGLIQEVPQTETTPFYPRSPYGVAKLYSYWITKNYREAYGIFACNGILFNHESSRRGETFVTRKITRSIARIFYGIDKEMKLGNLSASRDWGHAKDYVEAMYLMLQSDNPDDYVVATGVETTIKEFLVKAFNLLGVTLNFDGEGVHEVGRITQIVDQSFYSESTNHMHVGQVVIRVDPYYFRPTEVERLVGDAAKIQKSLGWKALTTIEELISEMVLHDLELVREKKILSHVGINKSKSIEDVR